MHRLGIILQISVGPSDRISGCSSSYGQSVFSALQRQHYMQTSYVDNYTHVRSLQWSCIHCLVNTITPIFLICHRYATLVPLSKSCRFGSRSRSTHHSGHDSRVRKSLRLLSMLLSVMGKRLDMVSNSYISDVQEETVADRTKISFPLNN